jgi:hypothetical protein
MIDHDSAQRIVETAALRALAIGDQDVRVSLGFIAEVVRRASSPTAPAAHTFTIATILPEDFGAFPTDRNIYTCSSFHSTR